MNRFLKYVYLLAVSLPTAAFATPIVITDASELDFQGNFEYAINFNGSGSQTVGDATFTNVNQLGAGSPAGMTISGFDRTYNWGINLGTGSANDALERVMNTLVWSQGFNLGEIDLALNVGATYRLQLLYGEGCCSTRNFDVEVADALFSDSVIGTATGGSVWTSSNSQGYAMVVDFTATDANLDIDLSRARSGDTNYHISGITVERIPEPLPLALMGIGLVALRLSRKGK